MFWAARGHRISGSLELHVVWVNVGSRTLERSRGETNIMGDIFCTPTSPVLVQKASSLLGPASPWPWFGTTMSPQLLGRMKGWSCCNKIPVFFFSAESCPVTVSVCAGQATHCLASSFGGCVPDPWPQAEPDPAPSRVQLRNPDGSSAGCCDPDHVPSPTVAARHPLPGTQQPWFVPSGAGISRHQVFNCAWL